MHLIVLRAGARSGTLAVLVGLALAGCASAPPKAGAPTAARSSGALGDAGRDGPEAVPPGGLDRVPDATPRVEAIRQGGPNKPYEVLGREYVPITQDRAFKERGLASWYGRKFQGRPTASGEIYDMYAMTAAHPTLPIPSYVRVRNPANSREIVVRVNDRGPFHPGRVIDLSYTAALKLDLLRGVAPVEVERITYEEIRAGTWRPGGAVDGGQFAARAPSDGAPLVAVGATPADLRQAGAALPDGGTAPSALAEARGSVSTPESIGVAPLRPAASVPTSPAADAVVARVEPTPAIEDAASVRAFTRPGRGFWVQLGAFRDRDGATAFQRRVGTELTSLSPLLAVFPESALYRLQAGPYPSREEARGAAESIRAALQLVTVIVERR